MEKHEKGTASAPGDANETEKKTQKRQKPSLLLGRPIRKSDRKVVGLKDGAILSSSHSSWVDRRQLFLEAGSPSIKSHQSHTMLGNPSHHYEDVTVEEKEKLARSQSLKNPLTLLFLGNLAALKVFSLYLVSLETLLTCVLTSGLTVYWYLYAENNQDWNGAGMDFVILGFAVTSPIAAAIGMAFTRRENALVNIADIKSFAHHLYLAHCLWDWSENGGRAGCSMDLREHCDGVMAQLVGIGDELSRFLTLPTTSRSRHRMTRQGRREASRTIEVAYRLLDSMLARRITRLSVYAERLKQAGLPSGEVSRIRQYERFLENGIERLKMIKM
jgi:hypothetical protein